MRGDTASRELKPQGERGCTTHRSSVGVAAGFGVQEEMDLWSSNNKEATAQIKTLYLL